MQEFGAFYIITLEFHSKEILLLLERHLALRGWSLLLVTLSL